MTKNNFNTAPNGTSVVNVSEILNEPTTLVLDPVTNDVKVVLNINPKIDIKINFIGMCEQETKM